MTTGGCRARGCAALAARAAVVALGLLVGGCTALLGVTDVTEAVDASDGGGGPGASGDTGAADGTITRGGDAGADSTTNRSADAALDSTSDEGEHEVGSADSEAGHEVATPEAGDGGMPVEAGCLATDLLCDGGCVPNDTHHCGTCGNDCTALLNVGGTVACVSGVCSFSCNSGWAHCPDAGAAVKCETDVSKSPNCGRCGNICPSATPLCSGSGGTFMCVSGCPVGTPTLCGSSCVDTTSSAGHCGSCTNACTTADPHAQPACVVGACTLTCNAGYTPCPTGCVDEQRDTANCGACGTACMGATPVCLNKGCVACKPASIQCVGAVPQTCDASGAWQSSAVTAGQCGAVCTPSAMQCSGTQSDSLQSCGPDGKWDGAVTPCAPFACGVTSCKSTCATDADCSAGNFCWNSTCVKVAKIAAGGNHTCALTTAGGVQCWGDDSKGQSGDNATTKSLVPVAVSSLSSGVSAVAAGGSHTCALTTAGGLQCWGYNAYGQVGNNTTTNSLVPVAVSSLSSGVFAVAAGGSNTCALTTVGSVQCWGFNADGELGNNATTNSLVPVTVSGLSSGVSAIAAGGSHTCALTTAGGVQCWGSNGNGALGNNSNTNSLVPVAVSGLSSGVSAIAAGADHTCALTTAGGVKCWGFNSDGQLGNNATTSSLVPVAVSGLSSGVAAVAAGDYHTCALTTAGRVQCWGFSFYGALGNNATINSLVPVQVVEP